MHIEVLQENLINGLNNVSRVVPSHPLVPLLSEVFFQAKNGELKLIGGNGEIFIESMVGAKIHTEGEICLPTRTLQELVSSLGEGKIEFKTEENNLLINSGRFKGKINCQKATDYPKNSFTPTGTGIKISVSELKEALDKLLFCVAVDESRPALTGILFKKTSRGLQMAATDAFRLSVVDFKLTLDLESVIIPAKVLLELLRLCSEDKLNEVEVYINNGELVFVAGESKIFSRLISANFPDYEKIIPTNNPIKIFLPVQQFLKSLKTAAIFAKNNSNIVKLNLSPEKKIVVTASASGVGEQEQEIEGKIEGEISESLSVAFNCRYILDFIGCSLNQEEITLELSTPLSPVLFRVPTDPYFLHVIMPVRL